MFDNRLKKTGSQSDIFARLPKAATSYLKAGDYGLYRNELFSLSESLRKAGEHIDQLNLLFVVFYVDLAGFSDKAQMDCMVEGFVPVVTPMIAPRVIKNIQAAIKEAGVDKQTAMKQYFELIPKHQLPAHLFTIDETCVILNISLENQTSEVKALLKSRKKLILNHK